jgi:ribosome production factor 1
VIGLKLNVWGMQKEGRKARQKRQKEALALEAVGQAPVKRVPRTIENTREDDVTFVRADDEDIAIEEEQDEFAAHFNNERPPHVLLTTCYRCTGIMYKFCADLLVRS